MIVRFNERALASEYICAQCGEKIEVLLGGTRMPRCKKCKGTVFLRIDSNNKNSLPQNNPKP